MPPLPAELDDLLPEIGRRAIACAGEGSELDASSGVLSTLRNELICRIDALLAHRRELLMSFLYRVDVRETLVVEAFRNLPPESLAPRLADLIIERQLEKVRTRRAFREKKSD